jgi:hypothetical protein
VYYPDGSTQKTTFQNGMLNTDIIPQGMAAYKIEGLKIEVPLFNKMDAEKTKSGPQSFVRDETSTGLGTLTGMLINTFPQFSDAYIFTDKTEKDFKQVTIEYRIGNEKWTTKKDNFYPYEFDIHLKNPKDKLEFKLIALDMDNKTITSNLYKLSNED